MTTPSVKLELEPRAITGKKVKQLRRAGSIPVHLYGPGIASRPLQCEEKRLLRALRQAGSANPITIAIQGEPGERLTFAREIQWNPVRGDLLHVDLLAVAANRPVAAQAPVTLTGESPGAARTGGAVAQLLYQLEVSALPLELPNEIVIDLEQLTDPNAVLRAAELPLPDGVTLVTDPEAIVVRVDAGRIALDETETPDTPAAAGSGE